MLLQHSDLSDDARTSVLQMYAKDLDHALRYQPQEREGSQAEDSEAKKQVHCIFNSAALYILGDFICQPIRT